MTAAPSMAEVLLRHGHAEWTEFDAQVVAQALADAGFGHVASVERGVLPEVEVGRLDAYYFSFESTGVSIVDAVLSAVATAGKAYHHTESWSDGWLDEDSLESGSSHEARIQRAANEAADAIRRALDGEGGR